MGGQGISMLVPTLLEVGSEQQRQQFIEPTLLGDIVWCQGYSEPGAGSDLAKPAYKSRARWGHLGHPDPWWSGNLSIIILTITQICISHWKIGCINT